MSVGPRPDRSADDLDPELSPTALRPRLGELGVPEAAEDPELHRWFREVCRHELRGLFGHDVRNRAVLREILSSEPDRIRSFLLYLAAQMEGPRWKRASREALRFPNAVFSSLLAEDLPLVPRDFDLLAPVGARVVGSLGEPVRGALRLVGAAERSTDGSALSPAARTGFRDLARSVRDLLRSERPGRDALRRALTLAGEEDEGPLPAGEAWADLAMQDLDEMDGASRATWERILAHGRALTGAKPNRRWEREASALAEELAPGELRTRLTSWFGAVKRPEHPLPPTESAARAWISDGCSDALRGLSWIAGVAGPAELAEPLGGLVDRCFTKIPGHGPYSVKVGNAALQALGRLPGAPALAQLSRLSRSLRYAQAKALTGRLLSAAAEREGVSRASIEERVVPGHGLDPAGVARFTVGDAIGELTVDGLEVRLGWVRADGRRVQSVPAAVKRDHPTELAALRRSRKKLKTALRDQRDRLEGMLLTGPSWPFSTWRSSYLDHPLVSRLARGLIWQIRDGDGETLTIGVDGLVDLEGRALDPSPDAEVRLWHPIGTATETVLAWRRFLEDRAITQPFKQAHREVYLLTRAELETGTYSNRFAAHVLRQHQLAALCRERGWGYRLQGAFDSHDAPVLEIPGTDLTAELEVDPVEEPAAVSGAGIHLLVTTGRIHVAERSGRPRALRDVHGVVLSEVLRDVDLFVSAASVGADPTWIDDGDPPGGGYWRQYCSAPLRPGGLGRRDLLGRLLPRLAIAARCSLTDRHLVVKGDHDVYRIHLESAAVFRSDGQHVCIVPRSTSSSVRLPFEGDTTLTLVLSKALLLARDTRIEDRTIREQLGLAPDSPGRPG